MRHCFAYGTNMDRAGMAARCPHAEALGPAELRHHRYFIAASGYASVMPKRGATVHGVLWRVTARDLVALDIYEDVAGRLYRRETAPVHHGGKLLRAAVFVAGDLEPGRPRPGHQEAVVAAARAWKLPADYLRELESWLAPAAKEA